MPLVIGLSAYRWMFPDFHVAIDVVAVISYGLVFQADDQRKQAGTPHELPGCT